MSEVLQKPKKPRIIPLAVLKAKACGDTAALSRLGQHGNAVLRVNRAVENAKKEAAAALALKKAAEAETYVDMLVSEFKKATTKRDILAGAKMHAVVTRAGWDDNYDPLDEGEIVWFK